MELSLSLSIPEHNGSAHSANAPFSPSLSLSVSDASFAPTPSVINVSRERIADCSMNRLRVLGGNYVDYNTYFMELEESVYRELRWVNMGLIAVLFDRKERRRRDQ